MSTEDPLMDVPCRPVRMGSTACRIERRADGAVVMRVEEALQAYPQRYTDRLVHWATTSFGLETMNIGEPMTGMRRFRRTGGRVTGRGTRDTISRRAGRPR